MKYDFIKCSPEEAGMSSAGVLSFIECLNEKKLNMHSLMILRGDKVVLDAYWKPFDENFRHRMYSVTKSFVSVAIGILIGDGKLSLQDKIADLFPEYAEKFAPVHPYTAMATVRDLLMMSTCFRSGSYAFSEDWVEPFFSKKPTHIPGQSFRYDSLGSTILGILVKRFSGKNFCAFLQERLFDPAGMSPDIRSIQTPCGHDWGASGLLCTTRDLAKFARICMNGGRWQGQQLIPEDYISAATGFQIDNTVTDSSVGGAHGYGYQFWRISNGFACRGMGGQFAFCMPEKDLILVTTADNQSVRGVGEFICDSFDRYVVQDMSDQPAEPDTKAENALESAVKSLSLRTASGAVSSPLAAAVNGRTYVMPENDLKMKWVRFTFEEGQGAMEYENATGKHEIRFGFGSQVRQIFPETHYFGAIMRKPSGRGYDCHASAAWRLDNSLLLLVFATDEYFGTLRINCVFTEDTVTLQADKFAELFFDEYQGYASGKVAADI